MTSIGVGSVHLERVEPHRTPRAGTAPSTFASASALGFVAFLISMLGSWIPSFWGDEAATVMSAQRSLPSLVTELGSVDAVHGTYYALMHVWIDIFGASPLASRFPSALAVGVAAAGIVVLVRRRGGLRLAVLAAAVFAVLPRTTYMGIEARSYALGTACAVWLAALFLRLVERRVTRWASWSGFAVGFAACIYVFLYLVLLALPFAAVLLWMSRSHLRERLRALLHRRPASPMAVADRAIWARWLVASFVGVVLASPLVVVAYSERRQIAFLGRHPDIDAYSFFVTQWFDKDWVLAIVAWAMLLGLIAAGVMALVRRARGPARMLSSQRAMLLALAAAWLALPPLALLAVNAVTPAYTVRYMSFATPALAVLLAVAIDGAARWGGERWAAASSPRPGGGLGSGTRAGEGIGRVALLWHAHTAAWRAASIASVIAVALIATIAAPGYVAQRGPYAMNGGSDWAEIAAVIQQHSRPGDDIVFDETTRPSRRPRLAMHLYPAQFANVVDATLTVPYTDRAGLWDATESIPAAAHRLRSGDGRVWLVEYRGVDKEGVVSSNGLHERMAELRTLGFSLSTSYALHRDVVYLFKEGAAS